MFGSYHISGLAISKLHALEQVVDALRQVEGIEYLDAGL